MDIFTFISDSYVDRYANFVPMVEALQNLLIALLAIVLTLDDERKSWSIGKVLFIISRYYSLIVTVAINNYAFFGGLSGSGCIQFSHWQGWSGLITCMIVEKNFVINECKLHWGTLTLAKDESSVFESSTLPSGRILMKVLIRDCIGSYLVLFTVYLTFLTIWSKNTNLIETCFSLSVAFESIVGTRTILSIRKVTTSGGPDVSTSMVNDILT
ncbi:hypothetical protein EV359DRAFT_64870 [Lentinula novae-zelandiae]|nr:hypothetical protein EV359DRAFT_64870 [Lentinula novae-zelandiae]